MLLFWLNEMLASLILLYAHELTMPLMLLILAYLTVMLIIVHVKKDSSIANFTWGGGCMLIAWYLYFIAYKGYSLTPFLNRSFIVTVLISLWCLRLVLYVYLRYRGDDPRYQSWKQQGFKALLFNLFWIFGLNTIMMLVMSVPTFVVNAVPPYSALNYLDVLGVLIWIIGYYWESVSDYQMYKFTRNPANKGKIIQRGLWKYSRHPNYFGEVLMWWGLFLIALNVSVVAIIAPITITFLLLFVTGIPWAEKSMAKNPEYKEYKKHTSIFIPWFPK